MSCWPTFFFPLPSGLMNPDLHVIHVNDHLLCLVVEPAEPFKKSHLGSKHQCANWEEKSWDETTRSSLSLRYSKYFLGWKWKKDLKKDLWKQQTALVNSSLELHVSGSMFQWHPTVMAKGSPMPLLAVIIWWASGIGLGNTMVSCGFSQPIHWSWYCENNLLHWDVTGMWGDHKSDTWTQPIHFSTAPPSNSCTGHNKARWSLKSNIVTDPLYTWGLGDGSISDHRGDENPRRSSLNSSLIPCHRAVSSFVSQSHPHLLTLRSFRRSTAWGGMEWKSRAVWKGMGAGPWG